MRNRKRDPWLRFLIFIGILIIFAWYGSNKPFGQ